MIIAQGVEKTYAEQICNNPEILIEKCKFKSQLFTKKSGFVASINAMSIAEFILHNGGGRTKMEQEINHNIGVELHIKVGDYHDVNNPWATIYHDTKLDTSNQLINCVNLTENKVENKSRILKIIS